MTFQGHKMMIGRRIQVVAAVRSEQFAEDIAKALADQPDIRLREMQRSALSRADAYTEGDVLIFDVDMEDPEDLKLLKEVVDTRGADRPTIATAREATINQIRLLMRLGINDFVPQPLQPLDMTSSVSVAAQRVALGRAHHSGGYVVTFLRPTGGMGATTLAANCAYALNERNQNSKIGILDLDLQKADLAVHMDISTSVGISACLQRYDDLDEELVASASYKHSSGVNAILSAGNHDALDQYRPDAFDRLIDILRESHDVILVDTPPVWTDWQSRIIEASDIIVIVIQNTVTALRHAREMISFLHQAGVEDQRIFLVCNRFNRSFFGRGIAQKDVEEALGRAIDATVPSDFALISEAVNAGVPVSEVQPGSKYEKAVMNLAHSALQRASNVRHRQSGPVVPPSEYVSEEV